jgi:PEP-CTERM motif
MGFPDARFRAVLCSAVLFILSAVGLKADNIAYAGSSSGEFGFMDLNTGVFTPLGNSGQTLAGLAVATGSIFATSYHTADGTLFQVNPLNGSLSSIGTATGIDYDDFGSTTSGLYAVSYGATQDLYSINPSTGAATLIGPTGLAYGSWRGLSTNSSTLYFADGADLYTLNTGTGAATLVGAFGSSAELGVLLTEGGILYGGDDTNNTVDTINMSTGAATLGPTPTSSFDGAFYGLAPYPIPTGTTTPEPGTWGLLCGGIAALALFRRRLA